MPIVINKHNRAVIIPEKGMEDRMRTQQLRNVRDEDWEWLDGNKLYFLCPWVWEHERGCMGDCTMLVIGGGDSMYAEVEGAYKLVCNPRPYSPKADGMVAIDSVFWTNTIVGQPKKLIEMYPHHKDADFFFGPMGPSPHTGQGKGQFRFGIPVHPIEAMNDREDEEEGKYAITKGMRKQGIVVRVGNAIRQVNICGIAAWLVARYLSTGPIIFTGFPLKGKHIAGEDFDYKRAQYHKWEAVCPLMDDTYMHKECDGPLNEFLPKWEGS